jgi:hypothetical protein
VLTFQIAPQFRRSVNLALYLRQCALENRDHGFLSSAVEAGLGDDAWVPHRVGGEVVTEKLFRDYCTVLNDGYNSWHARRTKEAGGAQFLQQYEKQRTELAKMNWERSVRGWGVEEDIVLGWLRDGDDKAVRRFYIGKGTRMSAV